MNARPLVIAALLLGCSNGREAVGREAAARATAHAREGIEAVGRLQGGLQTVLAGAAPTVAAARLICVFHPPPSLRRGLREGADCPGAVSAGVPRGGRATTIPGFGRICFQMGGQSDLCKK